MKRYVVIDLISRWVVAQYFTGKDGQEIVFEAPTEDACYQYLRKVSPENETEKDDLEIQLDEYDLVRHLSKKNRGKILYCFHREKDKIVIRLREGWMWVGEARHYQDDYNPKAVVVRTVKEFRSIMKYAEEV